MTDDYLPRLARDVLAENVPATAPASLRARVAAVPTLKPGQTSFTGLRGMFASLVRVGAVAALVFAAGYVLWAGFDNPSGSGATSAPRAAQFDPSVDGIGILTEAPNGLREIPWVVALAVSATALYLALSRARTWQIVACGVALVAAAAAFVLGTHPGLVFGNAWGPGPGIRVESAPEVTDGPDAFHIVAEPNETYGIVFSVRNPGVLSVRVLGVVDDGFPFQPGWTALGIDTPTGGIPGIEFARPFEPFDLAPEEYAVFYLMGRAGPCAVGTTGTPGGGGMVLPNVEVAYSVMGIPSATRIDMPFVVAQDDRQECSPRLDDELEPSP